MDALAVSFETVQSWISAGGYIALFGLLFACGLGLPLPEDIPLIIAGALVANGKMNLLIASVCAWCGIIGGDVMLYHFGKKFGLEITRVPFIGRHVTRERIQRVEQLFHKYGIGVVAIGRLFAGIRGAMVVAAGAIRYNFVKFIIADGIAALISGGIWVWIGHWLGNKLTAERVREFKEWFVLGGAALVVGFLCWVLWKRRTHRSITDKVIEKAEQAPEPRLIKPRPGDIKSPADHAHPMAPVDAAE
ncbi:MAG: DedA family protein [Tepidisphaeraceae bacterium]